LLHARISSSLSRLVVFTNDARDFVAIEPVSHVNNAVNLVHAGADPAGLGLVTLQPGESLSAQMTIEVESVQ
jgi:aldose 1-epimerase